MDRHQKALEILHNGTVIPAIPLALTAGRELDEMRQRRLIRYYLSCGAGGIAIAVHTTQFAIRKPEIGLFRPVLELAKSEIDAWEQRTGQVIVRVSGVCGESPQACAEAETARSLGFDAVLLSPGGLGHLREEQLIARTRDVAAIMPVIGFYLQEACGGQRLSSQYWRAVADTENVVAIKCASFNRYQTIDLVRGCAESSRRDAVTLYTGNDDNIVADLLTPFVFTINGEKVVKRFEGGLLGHWSLWTKRVAELYEQLLPYRDGRPVPQELLSLAAEITDANAAFFDAAHRFAGCIPGVHEVLRRQGLLEGTWCLDPEEQLSLGQMEEIDRVYRMYPHLHDDEFVAEFLRQDSGAKR